MKSAGDRFAKSSLVFAFLLMGFSFTVMQTLMARELLVSFAGNELSIGLVLGSWLILEAVGSGLAARLVERIKGGASSYAALQVALSLLLPLSVYAAFTVRRIVGITPGEGMGLVPTFYSALLVLLPLGLVDGDNHGQDKANTPWGYNQETGGTLLRGDFFLDPARALAHHASFGGDFSLIYLHNPYLADLGLSTN